MATRCPSMNEDGVICTYPEGHEGDHQGVETQYRWPQEETA